MSLVLTPRDNLVLSSLARAVRLLTLLQIAFLRAADVSNTRRRMSKLQKYGLVAERLIFADPPPCFSRPVCVWNPGEPLPNEHEVSYQAQQRAIRGPGPKHMTAYVPTYYTLELFGGPKKRGPRCKGVDRAKPHQFSHDVAFSQVFVQCNAWPKREWVSEDLFPASERGHGMKVVDALICTDGDVTKPKAAVDFLGSSYSAPRVAELAKAISERQPQPIPFVFY